MRVTTVIVCRNNKATIAAAIESVASQNYDENAVAVIDNASTDGSWEEIQLAGENLACGFSVEQEVSLAFAKNMVIRHMWDSTDLFIFLNPKDEILPYGLGRFAAAVDSGKIGLVYADELHYDAEGRRSHIYKSALIPESAAIGGNFAVTKNSLEKTGLFNETDDTDLDMVRRLAADSVCIHIAEPLIRTRAARNEKN